MSEEILFKEITKYINDAVIVTKNNISKNNGPEIIYVNPSFSELTGYSCEEAIGNTPSFLQGPDTDPETIRHIREALENNTSVHTEILNYTKSGAPYWVDLKILPFKNPEGVVTHYIAIEKDLTGAKKMQQELHRLAHMDALTGLTNKQHFMLLAESEFYRAKRYRRPLALIMFDLDNFERLINAHGSLLANEVLRTVAKNCRTLLRQSDIFGRISGDRFTILLPETPGEAAEELADRLCMLLSILQLDSNTEEICITASFGVSTIAKDDSSLQDIMARSTDALLDAKNCGRNTVRSRKVENIHYMANY